MYTPKPTRPAPVMYPLRMSHFSTLAISTGASPICFLRRLPNASESSPRTRTVNHPWVRDDSHSTSSPVAFLAMIVRSRFGSRLRTFSAIFSASVLDCQPFFSLVIEFVEDFSGGIQANVSGIGDDVVRSCAGLCKSAYNIDRFLASEEACETNQVMVIAALRRHTLEKPFHPLYWPSAQFNTITGFLLKKANG